ncbi:hypothetical protein GCM10029976_059420 [Kribbella albertanoniae]|uniref:Uncharacterized protein n=1 Tax=Kribbella albertanoniae TaxID=1266829 RepID=A0A4R4QH17_9ACTN|nr:hypothetical protein [Kribbella albertanoniae]TDC34830.1 hypothetical protein E1261_02690 [Kribbella albertanoniae]
MAYIPMPDDRTEPAEVTDEHRTASSTLLQELCSEVSSTRDSKTDNHLYVRVGHYEQPGFLNPKLFGFWLLPIHADNQAPRPIPRLEALGHDWASEQMADWIDSAALETLLNSPGVTIQSPTDSSQESPSIWACVLNSSIETQIESTLTALAMLVARQDLVRRTPKEKIPSLPDQAARVDQETTNLVGAEIRNHGWQNACHAIRARADASGFTLNVRYEAPLLAAEQIRTRMPLVRHVYNSMPNARLTIDKIVNVLTQGWTITGPGPESMLQKARDLLEIGGIPSLTAQMARDGFVCGMGLLSMEAVPLKNPWVIRPEDILEISEKHALVNREHVPVKISPVLPVKGGKQLGSTLGLSILEPLVITTANRESFLHMLLSAKVMQQFPDARAQVGDWPEVSQKLAEQQLAALSRASVEIFNPAAVHMPEPKSPIYFPGMEIMQPDVPRIAVQVAE